ncbi:hypothetical protein QUF99_14010 [Bacillus sp. DX4.1]|uniref:hypothetical protein n=1 Tax=Bacillus sp. DX4.1 TaxID=3055867 RepID=UPI0025A03DAB|nr:hypothetical protein [Bacillus sp. DX4.1]MDM5188391.1 hypothetical protein [Bacillus sp. DX4.1]
MLKRSRWVYIFFAIFLLTGCSESKQETDDTIRQYTKEKLGFDVKIVSRDSVDSGNMGNRSYGVQSKEPPYINFDVHVTGFFSSTAEEDDYATQKKIYGVWKSYEKMCERPIKEFGGTLERVEDGIGGTDIFEKEEKSNPENLYISLKTPFFVDTKNPKQLEQLLTVVQCAKAYNQQIELPYMLKSINIEMEGYKNDIEDLDVTSIETIEQLSQQMIGNRLNDFYLLDQMYFKHREHIDKMIYDIRQQDYIYTETKYDSPPISCIDKEVEDATCKKGFVMKLTDTIYNHSNQPDMNRVWQLVQYLQSAPIKIQELNIHYPSYKIKLSNLMDISFEEVENQFVQQVRGYKKKEQEQ